MKTEPTEALKYADKELSDIKIVYIGATKDSKIFKHKDLVCAFEQGQSSPKIKQLEWEGTNMWYFKAKTSLGLGYSITEIKGTYIVHFGDAPISWEKSLESAKAAAQEHFEKRVKECLK